MYITGYTLADIFYKHCQVLITDRAIAQNSDGIVSICCILKYTMLLLHFVVVGFFIARTLLTCKCNCTGLLVYVYTSCSAHMLETCFPKRTHHIVSNGEPKCILYKTPIELNVISVDYFGGIYVRSRI